ncbi:cytochrome c [Alteromonas sp. M12]|uniref:cytochrome c n=1 Tax=Alteromonas sp. M12 TaxID=3135644 RepID=UPI00319E5B82
MRNLITAASVVFVATMCGFALVYVLSEIYLSDVTYNSTFDYSIPDDAGSIEHGRYIARTRGCFGCHGQQLEGMNFDKQWDWPERAIAPNLAHLAKVNNAATLEMAIRQGIGSNGKAMVSMPSYNFTRLSDKDTAALIAFLRSAPVVEKDLPPPKLGWRTRWDLVVGNQTHYAWWAELVPLLSLDSKLEPELAHGEYLAMTMCNECHGLDLRGFQFSGEYVPDLAIIANVEFDEFERIVRTGRGFNGRHLGLMTLVAADRFSTLTDFDIKSLHLYLSSLQGQPVSSPVFWRQ